MYRCGDVSVQEGSHEHCIAWCEIHFRYEVALQHCDSVRISLVKLVAGLASRLFIVHLLKPSQQARVAKEVVEKEETVAQVGQWPLEGYRV